VDRNPSLGRVVADGVVLALELLDNLAILLSIEPERVRKAGLTIGLCGNPRKPLLRLRRNGKREGRRHRPNEIYKEFFRNILRNYSV
jgi:hypothetical protein